MRQNGTRKYDFNYRDNNRINTHETGTAPCKSACPAHIAVQGYIKMASQGRYQDALALIKKQNPFPAVCGAICNRRCEDACTRVKSMKLYQSMQLKDLLLNKI